VALPQFAGCSPVPYADITPDDGSLIWLTDPSLVDGVVANIRTPANQQALGIQEIFAGPSLRNKFNDPAKDPRTPDIILKVNCGFRPSRASVPDDVGPVFRRMPGRVDAVGTVSVMERVAVNGTSSVLGERS
jgi:hypothetical protein